MSRRSAGKRERKREANRRRSAARAERRQGYARNADPSAKANAAEPLTGTTHQAIGADHRWYMARTEPRMGMTAIEALAKAGVVAVIPRVSEIVTRSGRRIVRSRQLLLRTVFVGVRDEAHLGEAKAQRGVAEIVSVPHEDATATGNVEGYVMRPARLDPEGLQRFLDALADKEIVAPYGVQEGDNVVVRSGPFSSFPAVIEQILPNDMCKVGVSIFGRSTPLELPIAEVERVL